MTQVAGWVVVASIVAASVAVVVGVGWRVWHDRRAYRQTGELLALVARHGRLTDEKFRELRDGQLAMPKAVTTQVMVHVADLVVPPPPAVPPATGLALALALLAAAAAVAALPVPRPIEVTPMDARELFKARRYAEARAAFQAAGDRHRAAECAIADRRLDDAVADLDGMTDPRAWYLRGMVAEARGDQTAAVTLFVQARDLGDDIARRRLLKMGRG